jgi:FkbM family methyltransferase
VALSSRITASRVRARLADEAMRARLEYRRRRCSGELYVDYGWVRLLYSGDGDRQEIAYHLHQAEWHRHDMHAFRSLIAPGQTVVDVGANMGFVTAMLASLVGPDGRVVSLEPAPATFAKLQKTIAVNGLSQVVACNVAAGAGAATELLRQVNRSSGNGSLVAPTGERAVEIRVQALDDLPELRGTTVSLIKIDTEGYEPQVLTGARRLIERDRPVIYIEMGGDYVDSTLESIRLLSDAGYETAHVRSVDWSQVGNGSDYFFLPPVGVANA